MDKWLTSTSNPLQTQSPPEELSAALKAYIESAQALNRVIHTATHQNGTIVLEALFRVIHTAIHQKNNALREALKLINSICVQITTTSTNQAIPKSSDHRD